MQILSLNLLVSSNLHKNLIKLNRIYISERNISQLAVRSSVYSLHFGLMFQFQFMVSCFSFRLCCCCSQFPVSINLPQIVFIHSIISFFHSAILHFANYNIADWIVAVLWPELRLSRLSRLSICPAALSLVLLNCSSNSIKSSCNHIHLLSSPFCRIFCLTWLPEISVSVSVFVFVSPNLSLSPSLSLYLYLYLWL